MIAPRPWRISPFCPSLRIFFIMVDMSSNCLSSLLISCTVVPDPAAMRFLRLALMMSGVRRSFMVMDEIIALCRANTVLSMFAPSSASFAAPMPGSMPTMEEIEPILVICFSCLA